MTAFITTFGKVKSPCGNCLHDHCMMKCGSRETICDPINDAAAKMLSAIRAWLTCPKKKRPSANALGQRIADIAGKL